MTRFVILSLSKFQSGKGQLNPFLDILNSVENWLINLD